MTPAELRRRRLVHQQVAAPTCATPAEVVARLGAMQAQEFAMAKWAIALRLSAPTTDATVEAAFDAGSILRTHVLRPTWHFVAPADIRWLLALTAPRVRALLAYEDHKLELDAKIVRRATALIARALADGQFLTRLELGAALRRVGIASSGPQLGRICLYAELETAICSGPRRGKQFTYALLDARAPTTKSLTRDAALAQLAARYFASRGPATAHDFAWWSGLTVADARVGIATLSRDFDHETIDGVSYVFPSGPAPRMPKPAATFLMPDYDEYGMAYADRRALAHPGNNLAQRVEAGLAFNRMLVLDGVVVGTWRRTETRTAVTIDAVPFAPLRAAQKQALTHAAQRFGAFLAKRAELVFQPPRGFPAN